MIKEISYPKVVRMVIYKGGNIVAEFHTIGINGGIDTDIIKTEAHTDSFDGKVTIKLEV